MWIHLISLNVISLVHRHDTHIGTLIVIWSAELIQCDGTLNLLMSHAMIAMTTTSNVHTYTLIVTHASCNDCHDHYKQRTHIHTRYICHTNTFDCMVYVIIAIHCGNHIGCYSIWPPHHWQIWIHLLIFILYEF